MDADEKRFIISTGSRQPARPCSPDGETDGRFSTYYCETISKLKSKF